MSESTTRTVTTWFLEQTDPGDLRGVPAPGQEADEDGPSGLRIARAEVHSPAFSRFLYSEVGADVEWADRLPWTREQWREWLERPGVETWVAYQHGTPAGYIELDGATRDTSGRGARPGTTVEISYFGLLPGFRGLGIGGRLLAYGARRAWDLDERWSGRLPTARVWLHTCSKDGPYALRNYQRRGFRIFAKEVAREPAAEPATETAEEAAAQASPEGTGSAGPAPRTPGPRSSPM
ncbi:GNAT family N-acetyltransferase [Streptomyces abyssalis]|uniref:GNAT family N-acetyltransferase n=1 Tax=Streptomyces abyssalis TaxID=933944 RepID=UPI00085CC807|nr:GNAT family N-acetyltransferase [Streptomyces abyssalis]